MGSAPADPPDPRHHPDRADEPGDVAEAQRVVAETQREVAEEQRVVAETQRDVAEEQRALGHFALSECGPIR